MNEVRHPVQATRSEWVLTHILAALTLFIVVCLTGLNIYSGFQFFSDGHFSTVSLDVPFPVRLITGSSVIAVFWLWGRMLVDFFRVRPAKSPVLWGFAVTFGSYLGALAYFWWVWRPRYRRVPGVPDA